MKKSNRILRIIDANLNRALEGIRIIEEVTRFILENKKLTFSLKKIRHKIKEEIENLFSDTQRLLMAREAKKDVGIPSCIKDEFKRSNLSEILKVNFKRTEEALRVLEEFTKLFDKRTGEVFKKLRFQVYSMEKDVLTGLPVSNRQLKGLYVILDQSVRQDKNKSHIQIANDVIAGGAKILQLREKNLPDREIINIGRKIRKLTKKHKVLFIINDRVDLCLALDTDGVHLGQDDISVSIARSILGSGKIIGVSTHNLQEALKAQNDGADYISIGPIFHTDIKPDLKPVGINFIRRVRNKIKIPFFVIGGIKEKNLKLVLQAGAKGVAVISAIMCVENIPQTTRKLVKLIK